MLDHVDPWGVDIANHCYTLLKIQYMKVNSELPAALGPWLEERSLESCHGTITGCAGTSGIQSMPCDLRWCDWMAWYSTAKLMEHQWTCHRGPLRTGPMRPKIHGYPMQSRLLWGACSQELAHHILPPWVLAREPWTQLWGGQMWSGKGCQAKKGKKLRCLQVWGKVDGQCNVLIMYSWCTHQHSLCIHHAFMMYSPCIHFAFNYVCYVIIGFTMCVFVCIYMYICSMCKLGSPSPCHSLA